MTITTEPTLRSTARQLAPLATVYLAVGLAVAMVAPFMTLFLTTSVHANPLQVTLFLIASPVASMIVSTMLGRLSDRRSIRRQLIVLSAFAVALSSALYAVLRNYWVLLALVVTVYAIGGALLPQVFAYARTAIGASSRAGAAISALRTLFSIAWVAGPPVAAWVLTSGGFSAVFAVSAGMYVVAGLLALTRLRNLAEPVQPERPEHSEPSTTAMAADASRRTIALTVVAFTVLQAATGLTVQSMPLFVSRDLGGSVGDAGLILGLCAGLEVPLMLGLGALSVRIPLRRLIVLGPALCVVYLAFGTFSTAIWQLAVLQLVNAASIAVIQGLGITYVQDLLPSQPGRASTVFSNSYPAGMMLSGPILGAAGHFGYRFSFGAALVLSVLGLVALWLSRRASASRHGEHDAAGGVPGLAGGLRRTGLRQREARIHRQVKLADRVKLGRGGVGTGRVDRLRGHLGTERRRAEVDDGQHLGRVPGQVDQLGQDTGAADVQCGVDAVGGEGTHPVDEPLAVRGGDRAE
jgi:SET family sugar efflux transporter-like MFS transporter